jgi:hypothetical protein
MGASSMTNTAGGIGMLVRCYEAMRNGRAFALLAAGIVGGFGLMTAAGALAAEAGVLVGLVMALVALAVYMAGINGAGLLLLDQADSRPPRSLGSAFVGGLHATLSVLLAFLLLGLGLAGVLLVLYLLSFLARIPGVGPVFSFLLAGPGAIVLAFCYGLLVIGTPLILVAVWRGAGVLGSIGRAVDIVLKRPLDTLLHFVMLALIVVPVAAFVIGLLTVTSTGSIAMFSGSSMFGSLLSGGYGGGYGYGASPLSMAMGQMSQAGAAGASVAIVMLVLVALFTLVGMFGYIMIHDSLGAGLEAAAEGRLRGGISQLKGKLDEHRPVAVAPVAASTGSQKSAACGHCGAVLVPGDRFCGDCGAQA